MGCERCHSFTVCSTVAQFSRQLIFSSNIDINQVRPILVAALAANCSLYVDRAQMERDRKTRAAGSDN